MSKKIIAVFGTRPEAIKMAPLVQELKSRQNINCIVCISAQHRHMLDQVMDAFAINADYDLNIMKPGQTLAEITNAVIAGFGNVIDIEKPDMVLVHGDTCTAFAAALAAFYKQVPIGHVEAGLRTWDMASPFPEEGFRQMIDNICDLYFAPTVQTQQNLLAENKPEHKIFVTGNTVIDALNTTVRANYTHPVLDWCSDSRLLLLTAHRRENLGQPMRHIFSAIRRIVEEFEDVKVVYPIHMNPAVRSIATEVLDGCDRVRIIEPLDVVDFHNFIARSFIILTDSGGIQEEAPSLGKPVLVLRNTTERPEGIEAGTLRLTGTQELDIYNNTKLLLTNTQEYINMSKASNPYGDGKASIRIANAIEGMERL